MRSLSVLLLVALAAFAAEPMPTLDRLFSRPYAWGTSPTKPRWAKSAHVLGFLWNAKGGRFRDLYAWNADTERLTRLTDLENQKETLTISEAEKDDRQRQYLMPEAGLPAFEISDDGKLAAFAHKGDLYLASTDGKAPLRRLTRTKASESSPQFSPDSTRLASLRGGQVVWQHLLTGELWQVTDVTAGNIGSYSWSPDGKWIQFTVSQGVGRTIPLTNYSGRTVQTSPIPRSIAGDESIDTSLFIIPSEGGKAAQVDRGTGKTYLTSTEWSPDSHHVLISQVSSDFKTRRLSIADTGGGKTKVLFEEHDPRWVETGFASWSPDSKHIFFTAETTGWAQLYRTSLDNAQTTPITKGSWEIRNDTFSLEPQWIGDSLYYSSTENGSNQRQLYRIHADGTSKQRLSTGDGLRVATLSEDGKFTALLQADEQHPLDLWVNNRRVTTSTQPGFDSLPWPEVRYVQFPSKGDGKPVAAKLLLPAGYRIEDQKASPRPALVYVHGAGIATSVLEQWGSYNDLRYVFNAYLVSKGYLVLDLDYRGSTGYGRDWRSEVYLNMGGKDLEDVLGAVDYLKSLGNIDTSRLGIWGVSYGGFMTDMALFQAPGVFRAGAAWAAVNDWENYNAFYTGQRLNAPGTNPEAYRRSSPIWFSNNLRDKLLIVHGIVDDNVLFQDAVQLSEKLVHEGKDFSQIFYPEESHGFVRDETWSDALRRTSEWFDRWLK